MDNLSTIIAFTQQIDKLDMVQSWIDEARLAAPTNLTVQQKLDFHQRDIDSEREFIKLAMADLRSRN